MSSNQTETSNVIIIVLSIIVTACFFSTWIVDYSSAVFGSRMVATVFSMSSKLYWGGFLWAFFGVACGAGDHTTEFYLMTGLGDCCGVLVGNAFYSAARRIKALDHTEKTFALFIEDMEGGLLLASAAFCSGTIWQMAVNISISSPFLVCCTVTMALCSAGFFVGCCVFRYLYSACGLRLLASKGGSTVFKDFQIAVSVGGGSFGFVFTVETTGNFLRGLFGYNSETPIFLASAKAGLSVGLGFLIVQMIQNLLVPEGEAWTDVVQVPVPGSTDLRTPLLPEEQQGE